MGLIAAGIGSAAGVMADQWKDFIYCDSLDSDTLVVKGQKRVGGRSSNRKGDDNIISNGSVIAVNEGQCAVIVETGEIVEVCAQAGQFVYDTSTEPSIFTGSLGEGIKATFSQIGKRFAFGGGTGKDQRVYFFNTKTILDNRYGTSTPIPFRVHDPEIGLRLTTQIRCNGTFTYTMTDPLLFYKNVSGNSSSRFTRSTDGFDATLRSDLLTALQPALAKISAQKVYPDEIPAHVLELTQELKRQLAPIWEAEYGICIKQFAINSISIPPEDMEKIQNVEQATTYSDPMRAGGYTVMQQGEAMKNAASNSKGAMNGFIGMNMAQQAGGVNAAQLFEMGRQQQMQQQQQAPQQADGWKCPRCGRDNPGEANFCMGCGTGKPEVPGGWFCPNCGNRNSAEANFCMKCGTARS